MTVRAEKTREIRQGRKFERVRDGATVVFFRDGYAGTSVDDIAGASRVSKATLYSYFPDKSVMFREVIRAAISDVFSRSPYDRHHDGDVTIALTKSLTALAHWSSSKVNVGLLRLVTAEALRFPQEAAMYERAVQAHIMTPLVAMIDQWIHLGLVNRHDSGRSAQQLVSMVSDQVRQRTMFTGSVLKAAQISELAHGAAQMFLSTYGLHEERADTSVSSTFR